MQKNNAIKIECACDKIVPLKSLKPHPKNPNRHPREQIELLAGLIASHGWRAPIVVSNRTGLITRGHGRLRAAKALGCDVAPVDYQDYKNEEQEIADLVADNKIQELSTIDEELLEQIAMDAQAAGEDLRLYALTDEEIDALYEDILKKNKSGENDVPPVPEKPTARPGDLFVLGKHRLICGDATRRKDFEALMAGDAASMVFTDPPYGVNYEGKRKARKKIKNDNLPQKEFARLILASLKLMRQYTVMGGGIYVCHSDVAWRAFRGGLEAAGWELKQTIIWAKNTLVLGRQDYHWRHEPILYGWNPGAPHRFYGGRKQQTVLEDDTVVTIVEGKDGATISIAIGAGALVVETKEYRLKRVPDDSATTLWRIDRPLASGLHPTMKPVALVRRAVRNSSRPGEIVLDPFCGSGSTIIACEDADRRCRAIEIDPLNCDVIVKRWEDYTGEKAEVCRVAK